MTHDAADAARAWSARASCSADGVRLRRALGRQARRRAGSTALRDRHTGDATSPRRGAAAAHRRARAPRWTSRSPRFLPNPALLAAAARDDRQELDGRPIWHGVGRAIVVVVARAARAARALPLLLALLVGLLRRRRPAAHGGRLRSIKRRDQQVHRASSPTRSNCSSAACARACRSPRRSASSAHEVPGPVGEEFRSVTDKMKIGRTMDAALQETADRLGTPEFQFFVITPRDPARDRRQPGRDAVQPRRRAAQARADEAQDQGDVVGIEGIGLYRRLAAVHRLRR